MTRRMEWTQRHWEEVRSILEHSKIPVPYYWLSLKLREQSSGITEKVADLVLKSKVSEGEIELVQQGSRRKGKLTYVRLRDRTARQVTDEDLQALRS